MWLFSKKKSKKSLGVDIGSQGIRVVELFKEKDRILLNNYAELEMDASQKESFECFDKRTLLPSSKNVASGLQAIFSEGKIETREAIFSLPDFSTFFTSFSVPPMTMKELPDAVNFEAKKHIPIPFDEVVLDWELIGENVNEAEGENRVLVMAIAKTLISEYKKIAQEAGITIVSLEAEVMGLKRAILGDKKEAICLVEIGYQSTTVNIVNNGFLIASVSFEIAGKDLTYSIAEAFGIENKEAEILKKKTGLIRQPDEKVAESLIPIFDIIIEKMSTVIYDFEYKNKKPLEEIVLAGGTSIMPGIEKYFQEKFSGKKVSVGNAFEKIFYPQELKPLLPDLNSRFSIALGEALKRFE